MRRLLALLLLPLFLLTACSDDGGDASDDESSSAPPITDVADVVVTGDVGAAPTIDVGGGLDVDASQSAVVTEGTGAPLTADQVVRLEYSIFDAATGQMSTDTYTSNASDEYLTLNPTAVIQPFVDALTGVPAGSRVVLAVPPEESAQGATASPDAPTAIFVLDVEAGLTGRATGTPVTPPANIPTVALGDLGKPALTVPSTQAAPTELLVQPLITGAGPAVTAGQTLTAHYTGVIWGTGVQFDSSWDRLTPVDFPIGNGSVIPGWDIGLVGQTVGSQVLLVVPPDQGYGAEGQPQAGIAGTDTLVFVVDILDSRTPEPDPAATPTDGAVDPSATPTP